MRKQAYILSAGLLWLTLSGALMAQNTFPASGSVGIGTTAPSAQLQVGSFFGVNSEGAGSVVFTPTTSANYIRFVVGTPEVMRLQSNGNVGIGTTSPAALLHIAPFGASNGSSETFLVGDYSDLGANQFAIGVAIPNGSGFWPFGITKAGARLAAFDNNGNLRVDATGPSYFMGNVGIGTTSPSAKLEVNGGVRFSGDLAGVVQTTAWTGVLCGGDYAESVDVTGDRKKYEPGDVLVIDPDAPGRFLKSAEPYSTLVTGVYSTKPGIVGRRQATPKSEDEVPMAMIGIVPVKVTTENGPIHPGDLLVSSSKIGYAMKGTDRSRMLGAMIGKALGAVVSGTGTIECVIAVP